MLDLFIAENRDTLLERSRARVALRSSPRPTEVELVHGIPTFLVELEEVFRLAKHSEMLDLERLDSSAAKHGGDLLRMGLTIRQVVNDYGDVCQTLTELAIEQGATIPGKEFRTLNLCLDHAIAAAVTEYARQRERDIASEGLERLGILAHEMRNSLNTAMLSFDAIKSGRVAVGGSTGLLHQRSLTGLRDLIDLSLADVRLEAGIAHSEMILVAELIEELELGPQLQAQGRGIPFTVTSVDRSVTIMGDRSIIAAAISNLLQNAFKFTRKHGGVSTDLAATYYEQRAGAGLIVTEGTSPSPNGHGYARIPGIWNDAQVAGWSEVTKRVHAKGAKIFLQLMHTGRVTHPLNLPAGAEVIAPSAVRLEGQQMWTDQKQLQDYPTPRAMTETDIAVALKEHVTAARNAIKAGFDGVELHGANGYLSEQFLNPHTNQRTDGYGGSVENRTRFPLEVIRAMADAIGKERVGIRLSPYGANAGMLPYPEIDATYARLADELSKIGIVYVHVVDHSAMGAPPVPAEVKASIRSRFKGTFIAAGGFNAESAQKILDSKQADLVAFGRPFLANPDLVTRFKKGLPLNPPDMSTFYSPGPKGYIDYPVSQG